MFIYVMDIESRDALIAMGYTLLKDNDNKMWVFANKEDRQFDTLDVPCVVSDILTF